MQKHCVKQARQSAFVKVRSVPASVSCGSYGRVLFGELALVGVLYGRQLWRVWLSPASVGQAMFWQLGRRAS